jgi:hypothetical protein
MLLTSIIEHFNKILDVLEVIKNQLAKKVAIKDHYMQFLRNYIKMEQILI